MKKKSRNEWQKKREKTFDYNQISPSVLQSDQQQLSDPNYSCQNGSENTKNSTQTVNMYYHYPYKKSGLNRG